MSAAKPSRFWKVKPLIVGILVIPVVGTLFPLRSQSPSQTNLPGTTELAGKGDLAAQMVEGIRVHLESLTAKTPEFRKAASRKAAQEGTEAEARLRASRKEKLRTSLGVLEKPFDLKKLEWVGGPENPSLVLEKDGIKVYQIRWQALADLPWEGLMLEPATPAGGNCILWPHAGQTPEEMAGLTAGTASTALGWKLAYQGCRVIIPAILSRDHTFSGNPSLGRFTNQPHREFVYRMLYEMGRTPLGLEVEATRSLVSYLESSDKKPLVVAGNGDGGRVALAASALDPRISCCWARGAFGPREGLWTEPIDRNTWDLLQHLGDAELVEIIAPRKVFLELSGGSSWNGPVQAPNRGGAAPGKLAPPTMDQVQVEFSRIESAGWKDPNQKPVLIPLGQKGPGGGEMETSKMILQEGLGLAVGSSGPGKAPDLGENPENSKAREGRLMTAIIDHCQRLWRNSEKSRAKVWKEADPTTPDLFNAEADKLRNYFHKEVIGELPPPSLPMNPKSRPWKEAKFWKGYEVTLDLDPGVFAYGILLLPKDLKPGEKRPVVVCQHGLEGRPSDVCEPDKKTPYYNSFGATLADRGYIVFAPQNCYIGQEKFRVLQRLANPLKLSIFSFIIRQHERIIDWLNQQTWTEPGKIAFYGLSYGGKTAMRVPAVLPGYCLSICSGDFNEWVGKNVSYDFPGSYIYTPEYEMFEFNLGHTFNYAEMAWLIAPRPFLVERGHDDGVGIDEMVAWEFARVRRFYSRLKLADKTGIAFFAGGHEVQGVESFPWLDRQLGFTPAKR